MSDASTGVRRSDVAVALVAAALGVYLMLGNVYDHTGDVRMDSHSWLLLPVWLAAVAPLLFWRRGPVAAVFVSAAVMAVHTLAFGWAVRCGAGLPLVWIFSYLVGTRDGVRRSLLGLLGAQLLGVAVLVRDSAAGPELIPIVAVIGAGVWGIGRVVRQRTALADELRARTQELRQLRDERAMLEVDDDRVRMSGELDTLLRERLAHLAGAADAAAHDDADGARHALAAIESDSRRTLTEMREIVGVLRGGEPGLAPAPSVANIDALLVRRGQDARLTVTGDPRALPASVELSAYRIVEHLLGVLADGPAARVDVEVGFDDRALEIRVSGPVSRGADVRGAVARARERARLQHGTLNVKVARGRARVVAQVPLVPV